MTTDLNKIGIFSNIFVNFTAKILKALVFFLLTILVARGFGPEGKGIITLFIFLPELMYFMLHFGLGNANIYFISGGQENERKIFNNTFWEGLSLGIISIFLLLLLYLFFPAFLGNEFPSSFLFLALIAMPFSFWETFFENIFAGKNNFKIFGFIIIINRFLLAGILLISFFILHTPLLGVAIIILCNLIMQSMIYLTILIKKYGLPSVKLFDNSYFKKSFDFGFRSYLACFLCYLVLRSDIYMLSAMKGIKEVGLYSIATNFIDALLILSGSMSAVIFPLISTNKEKSAYYIKKITSLVSASSMILTLFILLTGRFLIPFFFGQAFSTSIPPLFILLIAMYFWSLLSIITQFFAANRYPWTAVWIWIPGLLINILLNFIFIPKYGMLATAWSSVLAYFLTFLLHFILLQKYEKISIKSILIPQGNFFKNIKLEK